MWQLSWDSTVSEQERRFTLEAVKLQTSLDSVSEDGRLAQDETAVMERMD